MLNHPLPGMGGLGTALAFAKKGFKNISVFETASNLGFVGAGIQMPPNVVRVLDRLGCWDEIEKDATDVRETSIRRTVSTSHPASGTAANPYAQREARISNSHTSICLT